MNKENDIKETNKEDNTTDIIEEEATDNEEKDENDDTEELEEDIYSNFDDEHLYLSYLIDVSDRIYTYGESLGTFNYFFKNNSLESKDVSNEIKIQTALERYAHENNSKLNKINDYIGIEVDDESFDISKLSSDEYIAIDEKTIINYIYDMFGDELDNVNLNNGWYYSDMAYTFYYKQHKFYIFKCSVGIGGPMGTIKYYNKKYETSNDKLYVTLDVVYTNYYSDDTIDFEYRAYSDSANKNLLGTIDYKENNEITINGKSVDSYKDKLSHYKFTFTKNKNGYYTFNKVEKI